MKTLVIVESPSKAKTIQKYLGQGFTVLASGGHVCDLPQRTLGIDVDNRFEPQYEINPEKKETIKRLKAALKQNDVVYLATDPDREGEAISWHLKNCLDIPDGKNRIVFNEISKKAVNNALENPRELDMNLVNSQQARRVLDRLVGYKISPIIGRKIKSGSSAGRVQSAALEMVVNREREIRNFVPEEYWTINAFLSKDKKPKTKKDVFKCTFVDIDGKKWKVRNKHDAERIVDATRGARLYVDTAKRAVAKTHPAPPFTTSTLQQDASSKLSLTAPQTMQIAQQLYEGVDIPGEGATALVTYIRTDSVRISPEMQQNALNYIKARYGEEYAPAKPNFYKTKSDAQDAHEAIRPISLERTPESLQNKISRNQYRLYKLIYERFLASQMSEAVYNTLNVHITADDNPMLKGTKLGYKVTGRAMVFPGYTAVYNTAAETDKDDDDETAEKTLPDMKEGDEMFLQDMKHEQKFTKPPQRFTDATLVKTMEENGIGRPSTYASIISVIAKREYTQKDGKAIVPTPLGEAVCDYMVKNFPPIMDLKFTANMESQLDKVEEGGVEWQNIIESFYPELMKLVKHAMTSGGKVHLDAEESDVVCDKCGAKMVIREGKYGKFLACPNYPKCKNIKPLVEEESTCPKCGAPVVKKKSKKGKEFYGCTAYPDCDFVSWDLPAPYFCPECGHVMKMSKTKDGKKYTCLNKECNHTEVIKESENQPK